MADKDKTEEDTPTTEVKDEVGKKPEPVKKAAKKKVAKKKAASKKRVAKKKSVKKTGFKVVDPDKLSPVLHKSNARYSKATRRDNLRTMAENVHDSINVLHERSAKRPVKLSTPAQLRRAMVPYDEIYLQYMINAVGFRNPMAIEIVAPEKIGATTFVMDWASRLLDLGCYVIYCECEAKPMSASRIKRLMDRDPEIANLKLNSIEWTEARTLAQMDDTLRKTVADLRARCDKDPGTRGNPIFFFADPWGALMSKGEAKGNSEWGLGQKAKKETPKDTTDGSNFEHSKHAQGLARWLPAFMEKYNCSVVFVNKQNDKIDMKALPSYMTPSPLKNDTRIGGKALKRLCAYRLTMLKMGDIREKRGEKRVYGHNIRMMAVANSYGPRDRTCEFSIHFDLHEDTEDHLAPGMTFDERTAAWMVSQKFLGTTVESDLYTCDTLGCIAVTAAELIAALRSHPEEVEYIGSQLGIEGYKRPEYKTVTGPQLGGAPESEVAPANDKPTSVVPE